MPEVVISNTSVLIIFQRIDELGLLEKIYGKIVTTPEVAEEFGEKLPDWISVQEVKDKKYQNFLETQVDQGEASVIALAKECSDDTLLLLDDLKARKFAVRLKLKITGTLGIIHKAKQLSYVKKVKPLIDKLVTTDFYVSDNIIEEILRLNNE
jgi:predicted nucleic acid-binding protein